MTLTTVLCPLDFSPVSAELVAYGAALAGAAGAELRLLHVLPVGRPAGPAAEQLAAYRASAELLGARVLTVLREGAAAPEIVAEAARAAGTVVVIGAHGQTGLTRFLMGSTAEAVVRTAPCATLLVKAHTPAEYRQSA